ncbi:MAG: acyltransferase [Solirubrobacterales bacterium]|nr:acyltransferase [Solirubrobacterales bacterium]
MPPPSHHRMKHPSTERIDPRRPPHRRRRILWSLAVVLLVVGAGLAAGRSEEATPRKATPAPTTTPAPDPKPWKRPLATTGAPLNGAAAGERCFGAASRDPLRPCDNPDLRLKVIPSPEDALVEPNARCYPVGQTKTLLPCAFGVPAEGAAGHVALIGDSHAAHWRAALEGVAQARRWHGISITRSGCPFSKAVAQLPSPADAQCVRWNRATMAWLLRHPQISTVFVSQHSGGDVVEAPGSTTLQTQIAGYVDVWRTLPATVTRIFVIRDTPRSRSQSNACIERAIARRKPAGVACGVPRRFALRPDPAVIAARRMATARVRVVNMTRYMCSDRVCPPVIGGALVHKYIDHLTQTFAATLGPYMLRRVNAVLGP